MVKLNLALLGLSLCIGFVVSDTNVTCPGPLKYYEDLGCKPVFAQPGDACAEKYNCDNVKNLPTDKCVVNGKFYNIGEALREEDANPCDIRCSCRNGFGGASFTCAQVDCFHRPAKPGCYRSKSPLKCCPGEEICPENPEDRATCNVNGKLYKDGEYFEVPNEPNLNCVCRPGYEGKNVEPFCVRPKHSYCSPTFRHASDVRKNCAPVYHSTDSPQTGCSIFYRCQNDRDEVISTGRKSGENTDPGMECQLGNLTLQLGDELNQGTDYNSVCVKCVCEVPPVPTCQRLPDDECDVTKHAKFDYR